MRSAAFGAAIVAAIVLAGCAEAPQRPPPAPEVAPAARRAWSSRVTTRSPSSSSGPGEDLATLAQRYLGDRSKRWRISEFNGVDEVRPGQTVVIPLKTTNPTGVTPTAT